MKCLHFSYLELKIFPTYKVSEQYVITYHVNVSSAYNIVFHLYWGNDAVLWSVDWCRSQSVAFTMEISGSLMIFQSDLCWASPLDLKQWKVMRLCYNLHYTKNSKIFMVYPQHILQWSVIPGNINNYAF